MTSPIWSSLPAHGKNQWWWWSAMRCLTLYIKQYPWWCLRAGVQPHNASLSERLPPTDLRLAEWDFGTKLWQIRLKWLSKTEGAACSTNLVTVVRWIDSDETWAICDFMHKLYKTWDVAVSPQVFRSMATGYWYLSWHEQCRNVDITRRRASKERAFKRLVSLSVLNALLKPPQSNKYVLNVCSNSCTSELVFCVFLFIFFDLCWTLRPSRCHV